MILNVNGYVYRTMFSWIMFLISSVKREFDNFQTPKSLLCKLDLKTDESAFCAAAAVLREYQIQQRLAVFIKTILLSATKADKYAFCRNKFHIMSMNKECSSCNTFWKIL